MNLPELIEAMSSAEKGSRDFDAVIARALGWRTRPLEVKSGETGDITRRTVWVDPKTNEPGNVPFYTTDLQDAYEFSTWLLPDAAAAMVVENGQTRVQIGEDSEPVYHEDSTLALCIATIKLHPSARG